MSNSVNELFSRLKSTKPAEQQPQNTYIPPTVSFPFFKSSAQAPSPIHSNINPAYPSSATSTPGPEQEKANNLLNLLRFNTAPNNVPRNSSAQVNLDLGGSSQPAHASTLTNPAQSQQLQGLLSSSMAGAGAEQPKRVASSGTPHGDFLLNLLNKPKEAGSESIDQGGRAMVAGSNAMAELTDQLKNTVMSASRDPTPVRQFGSVDQEKTAFEAPQPKKADMFNYKNPFDELHTSSPLNHNPKPASRTDKKIEILKHERSASSNQTTEPIAPVAKSRKLTGNEDEKSQSVSEALVSAGKEADKQADQAIADASARADCDVKPIVTTDAKNGRDQDVESNWESAEDSTNSVKVYNFPMKPFVQIQVKDTAEAKPIPQSDFIVVAQLKKEFDQIDRCLVTASQSHIIYAHAASKKEIGGLRIIRQDSGQHKQIYRASGERIFNVQICNSADSANDVETILGTGVEGSVFWTSLSKSRGEMFADDDVEGQGFIMPPIQTKEELTSGSSVKTRAKLSSRHPNFFAIARGKEIYIIAPDTVKDKRYCSRNTRTSNDRYHQDHSLKLMTGKAGKDFCFSEDDTIIVSLDKSGRLKFWDIRELTAQVDNVSEPKHAPIELNEPVWSLQAATSGSKPDDKPSVSSVMFLDKDRPSSKGHALRYMLVGFKQNHILQLWDLWLGKAVQEICLPHEQDSDGICSIAYHPKSGIVAIGHPTRNSIYFIHLSAPKYNLHPMDQAKYIKNLAKDGSSLPTPDSTAIMSGLREFSFAKVGRLRSMDMLKTPIENASNQDTDEAILFELYIMHSKGVTGVSVRRRDLGWNKDNRAVNNIDATQAGVIEVADLVPPHMVQPSEQSSNTEASSKQIAKGGKKADASRLGKSDEATASPIQVGSKQGSELPVSSTNPPIITPESYAMAAKSPGLEKSVATKKSPPQTAPAPHISSASDFQTMLTKQFDSLYQRIDDDKRVQDAAGAAKQDAVLRLVSSTLTDNVEKSLHRIIMGGIDEKVIPHLAVNTAKAIEKSVAETVPQQLSSSITKEIKAALPTAVQQGMKDTHVLHTISEQIATTLEQQVLQFLSKSMPAMMAETTNKLLADVERSMRQQTHEVNARHQQDDLQIQELTKLVHGLSETIHHMSQGQVAFQEQILKLQHDMGKGTPQASSKGAPVSEPASDAPACPEDEEVKKITQLLQDGEYDSATIQVSS